MTAAKVPDSNQDWEGIDIFLFSNGQQYSPPRKYHLRLYELHWWENTLNFLGRCQFGSSQTSSIDLYTTDGLKVSSPMELSNGMAYVAVKPPDAFIDAGYEQYLIKATKSWERRQSKKSDQIKLQSGERLNKSEKFKTDSNKYAVSTKKPDQRINVMATDKSVKTDHKSVITKPDKTKRITDTKHSTQQSTVDAIKIERKKPSSSQPAQHTATVMRKPIVRPVTPLLAGKIPLQKGQPLKGNLKEIPVKSNEKEIATIKTNLSKVKDAVSHLPNMVVAKTDETVSEAKIVTTPSETKTTVSSNKVLTESVRTDNVIENKDLNIDGLRNQGQMESIWIDNVENKDVQITVLSNQGKIENMRMDNVIKDDVNLTVLDNQSQKESDRTNNIIEEKDVKITVSSNTQGQIESIRIDNVNEEKDLIAISDIYRNTAESESISMLVDAENLPGVVYNILTREQNRQASNPTNLSHDKKQKFSSIIEEQAVMFEAVGDTAHESNTVATKDSLKKDPVLLQTTHHSVADKSSEHIIATVNKAHTSIHLKLDIIVTNGDTVVLKKETNNINRSQSLTELTKQNEIYKIEPSKSMQSLTTEVPHVSSPKYHKVVIMQCRCQDQCKNEPMQIVKEHTTYFIVLPVATQDEKQSCSKNENEQCEHNRSVNSTTDEEVQVPEPPTGVNSVRTDKDNYTQVLKNRDDGEARVQDIEKNDIVTTTSKVVFIDQPGEQTEYVEFKQSSQSSVRSTTTVQKPEYVVRRMSVPKTYSFAKLFRDVSTQSDWCNVMLEAKRHEDGRYSFHLPPLYLLSRYRV